MHSAHLARGNYDLNGPRFVSGTVNCKIKRSELKKAYK